MGKNPKSELHRQVSQILLEARDLVSRGWSRGAAARDGEGRAVDPLHPSARSWSLAGAVEAASAKVSDGRPNRASAMAVVVLAAAIESEASDDEGLRGLDRAIRDLTLPEGKRADAVPIEQDRRRTAQNARAAPRANRAAHCGVCTRELAGEGLHLISAEQMIGSFCSQACLAAAGALAALQRWAAELDGHGRRAEAEAREALGDELLLLWRRRGGPDPKVVTKAVELARARDLLNCQESSYGTVEIPNRTINGTQGKPALSVTEVVRAAGGVVRDQRGSSVLLVHRRRYDDWTFPKGKALEGESDEECALREVEEETGVSCELEFELLTSEYRHRSGQLKRVRYWAMRPVGGEAQPLNEINDAAWFSLGEAERKLSYDRDRVVLGALAAPGL